MHNVLGHKGHLFMEIENRHTARITGKYFPIFTIGTVGVQLKK